MQCKPHQSHHSAAQRSTAPPAVPPNRNNPPPRQTTLRPSQTSEIKNRTRNQDAHPQGRPASPRTQHPNQERHPQNAHLPKPPNLLVARTPSFHPSHCPTAAVRRMQPPANPAPSPGTACVRGRLCGRAVKSGCLRPRCGGVKPSAGWLDAVFWSQGSWGLDWGNAFWWRGCLGRGWGALGGSIGLSGKGSEGQAGG